METYLLVMYVTQEQESAIHSMFVEKQWLFSKADADKLMSSRKVVYQYDNLDQDVPTVYTESNTNHKTVTLFGDLNADVPQLYDNKTVVSNVSVTKITPNFDDDDIKKESDIKVPDIELKDCFINLEKISTDDLQKSVQESPKLTGKKRGRPRISTVSEPEASTSTRLKHSTLIKKKKGRPSKSTVSDPVPLASISSMSDSLKSDSPKSESQKSESQTLIAKKRGRGRPSIDKDTVKKLKKGSGLKVKISLNKKANKEDKHVGGDAEQAGEDEGDIENTNIDSVTYDESKVIKDESAAGNIDSDTDCEPEFADDIEGVEDDIEDMDETVDDDDSFKDSDYQVEDSPSEEKEIKDPDYGTKLKKKKKVKKEKFKCEKCNKTYKNEMAYNKHVETNCGGQVVKIKKRIRDGNSGHGEYKCVTCKKVYTYKRKYLKHYENGVCKSQCKYCGKVIIDMPRHIFHKHELEQEKFRCEICQKRAYDKHELRDHMWVHSDVKNYICDQCGKSFFTPVALYAHKKTHHEESLTVPQCTICAKTFKTASSIWYHMKVYHSDERNCVCEICGKRFKTDRCVRTHMRMHSDVRPYRCDVCDKSYKYVHQMYAHKRIYHNKIRRFFCSVCSKGFYFENLLKDHMNIHTGIKAHSCDKCSYTSYTREQLTQHRRKHRGEKTVIVEPVQGANTTFVYAIPVLE